MFRTHRKTRSRLTIAGPVLAALLVAGLTAGDARAQDDEQDQGLRIVVLDGEDSVNIIAQGTAVPTLVEVRDRNDLPVAGASVLFLLQNANATLNAGLSQVALTTNALGQAAVAVNPIAAGAVELSVSATFAGETATAAIVQTNFATAAQAAAAGATGGAGGGGAGGGGTAAGGGAGGGLGTGTIVGVAGAAAGAAVAVGVATGGEPEPPPPPPPPPPPAASAPSAPSAPALTAGDAQLAARWSAPSDDGGAAIDDYDVRYRPSGGNWTELPDTSRSTSTTATITGLTNGTAYEVQVRAGNSAGDGPWSASATGTPVAAATAPSAPSAPTLTAGDGELAARWSAPSDDGGAAIDDYDVRYRPSGGNWLELPDTSRSTSTTATITGLTNGTAYEVQVRAGNSAGDGPWSASATGTPVAAATAPSAPSAPTLTAGDGELAARWSAPSDDGGAAIDDYDVRYRPSGGNWLELPDTSRSTSTTATITGLTNGTAYEVQVRAGNSAGDGPWSASATGTPVAAASAPSQPSRPTLTAGDGQLDVSWNAPASNGAAITDYDVRYRRSGGSWTELSGEFLNLRATITGLTNGTAYDVQVRAANSVGEGPWSPSATGTPEAANNDRAVLMDLYNATDGPNWEEGNANWGSDKPLDQWEGVSTDENGRVIGLWLQSHGLSGSIPSSLGRLTNLMWLSLSYSQRLTGPIPSSLGDLADLQVLALQSSSLTGSIPSSLGNLTDLLALALHGNDLTGSIPSSLANLTNIENEEFSLWDNRLTGSIPAALCHWEPNINPQQGDVYLPCEGSTNAAASAGLSVADAGASENVDDTIDFTVTLDRASSETVSVDYATSDDSARAGADYTAASGTLTFSPGERSKTVQVAILDDAHDEAEEAFTLGLSNASGAVIVDGEATGRIENHDPLPRALVARFGRTAAVHVVEQVEERLQAPREPGIDGRFAGQDLRPGMERDVALSLLDQLGGPAGQHPAAVGLHDGLSGSPGAAGLGMAGVAGGASVAGAGPMGAVFGPIGAGTGLAGDMAGGGPLHMGLGGGDMLTGSAFALNRETRGGGVLSFWSRGAQTSFTGREGALALGGDVRTTMFGADYAKGPVVLGLSLSNSRGLGSYGGVDDGRVASSVTGLYPWLGYRATDRVTVWGVAGYGAGGMMLTPGGGPALESGLSMAMAAGGTRGELIAGGSGGFGLAFKADALWVGTSVDGVDGSAGRLAATDAAVTRFRTGLEGSREFVLGGRISLRPSAEVGLRHDGGDAETGAGMDVGGGLVVSDSSTGLAVDVRVRMLVVHQAEGFRERGMAVSLRYDPTPSTPLGFMARVAPAWGGEAASGAEALWGRETVAGLADGSVAAGNRLDTELGYGLPVGSRFVGTPRVGLATSEYGRDYRMGYGLTLLQRETLSFEMGVDARRRESPAAGGTDTGVLGRAAVRW